MAGAREICRMAWRRYRGAPVFVRVLMTLRPLICPLDVAAEAVPEGARVLDVGCGAGLWLRWLAEGRRLAGGVGVDPSADAIEAAQACATPDEPIEFVCCGPEDPWPDGPFDVATLVDVLHHVSPDDQSAFVARLVRTGAARVVVKDLDPKPRWKRWANALHDFLMTRRRVYPRAMGEVAAWLEAEGLRVTRAERVDRLWYSHYLVVAERP